MHTNYSKFKKLLEYFVSHLHHVSNNDRTSDGYKNYIADLITTNNFKKTGQGHKGQEIQKQISEWEDYNGSKLCINIQSNQKKGYKAKSNYINWYPTGINIVANWNENEITGISLEEFIRISNKRIPFSNEFTLNELGLFNSDVPNNKLIEVFDKYLSKYQEHINTKITDSTTIEMEKQSSLLQFKKQIILQGPPGTGKTRLAKELCKDILGLQTDEELLESDNFEIVQFHPSYSYEDFVEGLKPIVTKEKSVRYETVSGSFKRFCEKALASCFDVNTQSNDQNFNSIYNDYVEHLKTLPDTFYFKTKNNYDIAFVGVKESGIVVRYRYANSQTKEPGNHSFTIPKNKIQKVLDEGIKPSDIKSLKGDLFPIVQHIAGELFAVYRHFYEFIQDRNIDIEYVDTSEFDYQRNVEEYNLAKAENRLKLDTKFIFVIDEINRANLSSVLGELIYALEYRGDGVKSVYSSEEGNEFIIPPNLYIIGTMNTADRSVGHIDYAIRRRFAFVNVLPKDLSNDDTIVFHKDLFEKVSRLFIKNYDEYLINEKTPLKAAETLSSEFRPEDVWLGHSYFIQKKEKDENGNEILVPNKFSIRLEYEIKPILMEYVKDGILIGDTIKDEILNL